MRSPSPSARTRRSSPPRKSSRSRRSSSSTRSRTPRRSSRSSRTSSTRSAPRTSPRAVIPSRGVAPRQQQVRAAKPPASDSQRRLPDGLRPRPPGERQLEDPLDQRLELQSRRLGRHRQQARVGEAGGRIDLQHLRACRGEDQVHPPEARAAERPPGAERRLGDGPRLRLAELRGAGEPGPPDLVPGLEVIDVALRRDRLDHRQRLITEDTDCHLAPFGEALEQDPVVVAEGRDQGPRHLLARRRELDAECRPPAGRLDDEGEAQPGLDPVERIARAEVAEGGLVEGEPGRRRDAGGDERMLRGDLVHAERAGGDARPGVGDVEDLEQLLGSAVLALRPVQRDERPVGSLLLQSPDEVGADVQREDVVAEPRQRVLHSGAAAQRDPALERAPALEDRDLHRPPRAERRNGSTSAAPGGSADWRPATGDPTSWPVSVSNSSTCSAITSPIRRTPSRISSSVTPEKLSRIELPPRPSTKAAWPGTKATSSRSARASRSPVSM